MSITAISIVDTMKQALDAIEYRMCSGCVENIHCCLPKSRDAVKTLRQAIAEAEKQEQRSVSEQLGEPVAWMRMPKVGDRVVCIEDEDLGTIQSLTAGGSPDIKFDDGSHGTYLLHEFAELFRYADATPQPAQKPWVGLMRGVRVEGDTVVISVHYGNDAARQLCADLIKEMNT